MYTCIQKLNMFTGKVHIFCEKWEAETRDRGKRDMDNVSAKREMGHEHTGVSLVRHRISKLIAAFSY